MNSLSVEQQLYASAQRYAQRAARALSERRPADFFADAGVGLEHLAKAALVRRNPLLIIGAGRGDELNAAGLLWACDSSRPLPPKARTITCREAVRRFGLLVPPFDRIDLSTLIEHRHGVLHVGAVPEGEVHEAATQLAAAARVLLRDLGRDEHGFWGHHYPAVVSRLSEKGNRLRTELAERLGAAGETFEDRLKQQGAAWLAFTDGAVKAALTDEHVESEECPGCHREALLYGVVEEVDEYADTDDPEDPYSLVRRLEVLDVQRLQCMYCGLILRDELLAEASVDLRRVVATVDLEEWEPDEDRSRNR